MIEKQANDVIRIVDDDPAIRDAFCFLLQGEGWKTRAYENADDFFASDDMSSPGCIVLDVRMPGSLSGLELQEKLMLESTVSPIIFISAHGDIEMAVRTIQNGAVDFLPKPVDEGKLLAAIEKAVGLSHRRIQHCLQARAMREDWQSLTAREEQVARLLARGLANKTVADMLSMTVRTVQVHRAAIYLKLGVHSAAEISWIMQKLGLETNDSVTR